MKKVALPMAEGKLALHFGHCQTFVFFDVDEDAKTISGRNEMTPPPHEPGVLPAWLSEQGVDSIIAGGMGGRALQLFAQAGIKVTIGAPAAEVEDLVQSWLDGSLQSGPNACDH